MSDFDLEKLWNSEQEEHMQVVQDSFSSLQTEFGQLLDVCVDAIQRGNKIMFFGNGGSASDAQHLATELSVRFINDRKAIAGLALTTDTSTLTAASNDMGFEFIFSRQIEALGREGDIAIGISTSGNSQNVINALTTSRQKGIIAVGLTGRDGGEMLDMCDISLVVPSNTTARIQEMHITLGHMLCGALEQSLGYVDVV